MTSPLAQLFLRAERESDPIAIHYSHASIQVNWLLESTVDGSTWPRRFSSYEAANNRMARRRQAWVKAVIDAGYTPQFISSEQIERGELKSYEMLILPDSLALSDREAERIREFANDRIRLRRAYGFGEPGLFDAHGRLRDQSMLSEWAVPVDECWLRTPHTRRAIAAELSPGCRSPEQYLSKRVATESLSLDRDGTATFLVDTARPWAHVGAAVGVQVHRYRLGSVRLAAFERNIVWQMGEDLKQSGGHEAFEKPITVWANFHGPGHLYDLREGKYLGESGRGPYQDLPISPWQPSLYAILPVKIPAERLMNELEKAGR